jgi:RNA polymerase sigma-70 factor, ECF subfamily
MKGMQETELKAVEEFTDERLLIEAAKSDPACFSELYEQNFDRVYAFVSRRVGDRDEAEDLTAETFHQALRCLCQFEWRGAPFIAWLLGIASKIVADRWQRAARGREVPVEVLEQSGVSDGMEQHALLAKLIDVLPADQRLVVLRRFLEQRSVRDIAQELARSEGAIRQLQFRALETLRSLVRSNHD